MARKPRAADVRRAGPVMTVDQVAAYLQMNRLTVYRYVREGKIPAAKFGKLYRILKADVDRFLEDQKAPARPIGRQPSAPDRARIRSIWVRDAKRPDDIYVGPSRRERAQDRDPVFLSDSLAVIMRSLN